MDRVVFARNERRAAVLEVIAAARHSLRLSVFRLDDRRVLAALADACARGVRVDALVGRRSGRSKVTARLLRLLLEQAGVTVWRAVDPGRKYHCKFIVADEGTALVGSLNLTRKCFKKTSDFLVVSRDPLVAGTLVALFEADRGAGQAPVPSMCPERLLVAPESARHQLTTLLAAARTSIRIVDGRLTDAAMRELLERRAKAGVDVRLACERQFGGLTSHGPLVILDGRQAIVGSLALSAASLDERRELALVVDEPAAVGSLVHFFDEAWQAARPRAVVASGRKSVA
jgi:cardiolipin synthase